MRLSRLSNLGQIQGLFTFINAYSSVFHLHQVQIKPAKPARSAEVGYLGVQGAGLTLRPVWNLLNWIVFQ